MTKCLSTELPKSEGVEMESKSRESGSKKASQIRGDVAKRESAIGRFLAQKEASSFKRFTQGGALTKEKVEKVERALEKAGRTTGSFEGRHAKQR